MDTLPYLREPERYNRIYATVAEGQDDLVHIRQVTADLKDKIEKAGYQVRRTNSSKTHEHPLASVVNAILGILMALGVLIVFLSSSLIANTLNALLNQHLRHIGVMKLVGGRRNQIFSMYIVLILTFGLLALLIAVPLGGQGAYALSRLIADLMSFTLQGYRIVPIAFVIQALIGLLIPLAAGAGPLVRGTHTSVLQAISGDSGRGDGSKPKGEEKRESRWERFQVRAAAALGRRGIHIPRPLLISLRNTFRRRSRFILTLFTLTMGGAIFISVFNVRVSLHEFIGAVGKYFLADVTLDFDQPYRLREIEQYARQVPGVVDVEGWAYASAEALYADGSTADNITILAPPAESPLVAPIVVAGRWIRPDDKRALAVTEGILALYPDLKPGDAIRLKINGQEETWEVVGLFKFIDREGYLAYAPYEYISRQNNQANQAYSFRIATEKHDRPYQTAMSATLDQYFRDAGFKVRQAQPGLSSLDKASESLDILIVFLLIMALLTATVGSMGLTGTMGMNVLERTREIGIMRAVGATDGTITRMVMIE
jgi:putative ABC transport system permease protein